LFQIVEICAIDWVAKDEDGLDLGHGARDPLAGSVHVQIAGSTLSHQDLFVIERWSLVVVHVDVAKAIMLDVRKRLSRKHWIVGGYRDILDRGEILQIPLEVLGVWV